MISLSFISPQVYEVVSVRKEKQLNDVIQLLFFTPEMGKM